MTQAHNLALLCVDSKVTSFFTYRISPNKRACPNKRALSTFWWNMLPKIGLNWSKMTKISWKFSILSSWTPCTHHYLTKHGTFNGQWTFLGLRSLHTGFYTGTNLHQHMSCRGVGAGNFLVNPWFHTTSVGLNLESTRGFPISRANTRFVISYD